MKELIETFIFMNDNFLLVEKHRQSQVFAEIKNEVLKILTFAYNNYGKKLLFLNYF